MFASLFLAQRDKRDCKHDTVLKGQILHDKKRAVKHAHHHISSQYVQEYSKLQLYNFILYLRV